MLTTSIPVRRSVFLLSAGILLVAGYFLAFSLRGQHDTAWIYVTLFYGGWILVSLALLLKKADTRQLLSRGKRNVWYLLPGLVPIPIFFLIFLPNRSVLQPDLLLVANIVICLLNPWMEEFYWRGLPYVLFKEKPAFSFLISALGFGLSHPFIFGINSPGIRGLPGFTGAFLIGAVWWFCLRKTGSMRGAIITHFLIDAFGLAAYVLADKLVLMDL